MNRTSEKSAFPYWKFGYSLAFGEILTPQQQKSENQKILYSPVGEKKTTEFVSPKKNLLARAN